MKYGIDLPNMGGCNDPHLLAEIAREAEEAGWIPVRCELITGTYHYLAIFVQQDLFPPETPKKKPPAAGKNDG